MKFIITSKIRPTTSITALFKVSLVPFITITRSEEPGKHSVCRLARTRAPVLLLIC